MSLPEDKRDALEIAVIEALEAGATASEVLESVEYQISRVEQE